MKKILFVIFSLIMFVGCSDDKQTTNEQLNEPSNSIQYTTRLKGGRLIGADIRIITLTKDGKTHDYVVATNRAGRGGGVAIVHWEGCACRY